MLYDVSLLFLILSPFVVFKMIHSTNDLLVILVALNNFQ